MIRKQVSQTDKQKLAASLPFCPGGDPESYRLLSLQVQSKITDRFVTSFLRVQRIQSALQFTAFLPLTVFEELWAV